MYRSAKTFTDVPSVAAAVSRGYDVSSFNNYAARMAAARGHLDVLRYLVEDSGCIVDVTDQNNVALSSASLHGHLDIIRYLIEDSGQAVDATGLHSNPVGFATKSGHFQIIQYLCNDSDQDIDVSVNDHEAVKYAIMYRYDAILRFLLERYNAQTMPSVCETLFENTRYEEFYRIFLASQPWRKDFLTSLPKTQAISNAFHLKLNSSFIDGSMRYLFDQSLIHSLSASQIEDFLHITISGDILTATSRL